jgi:predicted esterase
VEINTHTLKVTKTAHYYTYGEPGSRTRYFLMVCHGYAQKADVFLQNFQALDPMEYYIVAPEGFSRFYRKGFQGDVVASWMTSADRLHEINDYVNYLQQLYDKEIKRLGSDVKVVLLGFSQGATTIWRWIYAQQPRFDIYINWAGWIAEDIDYDSREDLWQSDSLFFVYGNSDPFLPDEKIQELKDRCQKFSIPFKFVSFNGVHAVDAAELKALLDHRFSD